MKAILLAAGRGTRISRYLDGNPKCTVDLGNGTKLIEYSIAMLKKKGITEIALVTGYRHRVIEDVLKGANVKFFYNPFYDVTNSLASLFSLGTGTIICPNISDVTKNTPVSAS